MLVTSFYLSNFIGFRRGLGRVCNEGQNQAFGKNNELSSCTFIIKKTYGEVQGEVFKPMYRAFKAAAAQEMAGSAEIVLWFLPFLDHICKFNVSKVLYMANQASPFLSHPLMWACYYASIQFTAKETENYVPREGK